MATSGARVLRKSDVALMLSDLNDDGLECQAIGEFPNEIAESRIDESSADLRMK